MILRKLRAALGLLFSDSYILLFRINGEFGIDMKCNRDMVDAYLTEELKKYLEKKYKPHD